MKKLRNVMLALALLLLAVTPVLANGPIDTGAVVDPCGLTPVIKAKWERVDEVNFVGGGPGSQTITPNPGGPMGPGTTQICVYAVVTDPNGVQDVDRVIVKVYHPGEGHGDTPKAEGDMVRVPPDQVDAQVQWAIDRGLIDWDLEDLWKELHVKDAELWMFCWEYEIHQPDGCYNVWVKAKDKFGNFTELMNQLCVESIVVLVTDFGNVDFGQITPGVPKKVYGDDEFGTGSYTVWNVGNNPAQLCATFSNMVGHTWGEIIGEFDFTLHLCGGGHQNVMGLANEEMCVAGPLLTTCPKAIDFSVYPPEPLSGDEYRGTVVLEVKEGP